MRFPLRMAEADILTRQFPVSGGIPNHPTLPLVVYRRAFDPQAPDLGGRLERTFRQHGWGGNWRGGVYGYQHYHPDAHEVLGCYQGTGLVRFGGPDGELLELQPGDVAVLPAGTGHCREGGSPDFAVVGGYPPGQEDYSICRDEPSLLEDNQFLLKRVPKPRQDPVQGATGPLVQLWGL